MWEPILAAASIMRAVVTGFAGVTPGVVRCDVP
jgi:hypothetical protein